MERRRTADAPSQSTLDESFESDDYYLREMRAILREHPRTGGPPAHPVKLLDHVYIGNQRNADSVELLQRLGITHVLNCAGLRRYDFTRSPYPIETGVKGFLMISALDHESFDIASHFDEAIGFLDRVRRVGGRALVHCNQGVNRSGAVVAAYLMVAQRQTLLQVTNYLKLKRFVVLTNKGFRLQLVQFARRHKLLDSVIDVADDVRSYDDVVLSRDVTRDGRASAPLLRSSFSLFDSLMTTQQRERKDAKARALSRNGAHSTIVDARLESAPILSVRDYKTLPRVSGSRPSNPVPPNPDDGIRALNKLTIDCLPTVEITAYPEPNNRDTIGGYHVDNSDTKSRLKPAVGLMPVRENDAAENRTLLTSKSQFSGFWQLLQGGAKRKPIRSTSYSNVSTNSLTLHATTQPMMTSRDAAVTSFSESAAAPLSTSRPLRVYTRSSTDSELYRTKAKRSAT